MSNATLERDPRLIGQEQGLGGLAKTGWGRVRSGDLGSLPVILGLAVIWAVLQSQNDRFLSPGNLVDLARNISYGGLISLGIVMVLLIGEIDLSVGSVSGLSAAAMGVVSIRNGADPYLGMLVAVLVGAAVGLVQGFVFSRFHVPSFVVTLAGLLALLGLQLHVLGRQGTITFPFGKTVSSLTNQYFNAGTSYALVTVALVVYIGSMLMTRVQQVRAGLPPRSWATTAVRGGVIAVVLYVVAWEFNRDRGLPLAFVIFLAFVVFFSVLTTQTTYGRHVFAVGGNIEAARRAGIRVNRIRISVFIIAGAMAAVGGIMNASYVGSVGTTSGGSDLLLDSIAAAVIGGTSLFGGRGSAWSALLGWLVIGSITNGMALLGLSSDIQFMITGGVLLAAATIDALARRGRQSHGMA